MMGVSKAVEIEYNASGTPIIVSSTAQQADTCFLASSTHMFLSCRYGSHWKVSEAEKNLLRTHTTAVSSRMLYKCDSSAIHSASITIPCCRLVQRAVLFGQAGRRECMCRLAKSGFKPAKFFSIDRVFRNEAIDRTHLAEFHQIEGARHQQRSWKTFSGSFSLHALHAPSMSL